MLNWYHHLRRLVARVAGPPCPPAGRRPTVRPKVEALEARWVPSGRPRLTIDFNPVSRLDLLSQTPYYPQYQQCDFEPNVAASDTGSFVHANNMFKVLANGEPTTEFTPTRWVRTWKAPLDENGNEIGKLGPLGKAFNETAHENDTPGVLLPSSQPGQWDRFRQLQEFVLGVEGHPEAGFWYYTVVVDTAPSMFNVYVSDAQHITAKEFQKIKKSKRPFEEGTQGPRVHSTGWTDVPANCSPNFKGYGFGGGFGQGY
jgi:hypothetical protein